MDENKYANYKVLKYVLSKVKKWVEQIFESVKFTFDSTLTESEDKVVSVATPVQGIISQEDFDELLEEKQNKGAWVIPGDTKKIVINGESVEFENGVTSFNGRLGVVIPQSNDYTADMVGAATLEDVDAIRSIAINAKNTLEKTSASSRTVEVAASEFDTYIKTLPRLLTENLTIKVGSGVISTYIVIDGFYGFGKLIIEALDNATVVFTSSIFIRNCSIGIELINIQLNISDSNTISAIQVMYATAKIKDCIIKRNSSTYYFGFEGGANGVMLLERCSIDGCHAAIGAYSGTIIIVSDCSGTNNQVGVSLQGGIVIIQGSTSEFFGGGTAISRDNSGIVIKKDGTIL